MTIYKKLVLIIILVISLTCLSLAYYRLILCNINYSTSYWVWAGITSKDAPPDSELYIYQGLITNDINNGTIYARHGLYPHPLKSKKLYLVYRLEGNLPDAQEVVKIFQNSVARWQVHSINPTGLQLDFDSPTSKLLIYSNFLKKIRDNLPASYDLSITGLGDWSIRGNKKVMESISAVTDEIVFQLYQGYYPLRDIEDYIRKLRKYPLPFRVGLLSHYKNEQYLAILEKNVNFKGVIYFIQKRL